MVPSEYCIQWLLMILGLYNIIKHFQRNGPCVGVRRTYRGPTTWLRPLTSSMPLSLGAICRVGEGSMVQKMGHSQKLPTGAVGDGGSNKVGEIVHFWRTQEFAAKIVLSRFRCPSLRSPPPPAKGYPLVSNHGTGGDRSYDLVSPRWMVDAITLSHCSDATKAYRWYIIASAALTWQVLP